MDDNRYGKRFWTEIAALYVLGAVAIFAWLQVTSLPQQDVLDGLSWIPGAAAIAGWFKWRRTHSKLETAGTAASWGLIGGAIGFSLVILVGGSASAQTITDGDTLKLNGTVYRLWGIDAPETKQDCLDGWPAGRLATTHLQSLISGRNVICERKDTDRYGRTVAICRASGEDLGALMVRDGYAWAFLHYSRDYADEEARAKAERAGVHGHDCTPAWDWRAARRSN